MQSRLFCALSSQLLKTPKDGMPLGNLFQMVGSPKAFSAPGWLSPAPRASPHRTSAPVLTVSVASPKLPLVCKHLVLKSWNLDAVYWVLSKGRMIASVSLLATPKLIQPSVLLAFTASRVCFWLVFILVFTRTAVPFSAQLLPSPLCI